MRFYLLPAEKSVNGLKFLLFDFSIKLLIIYGEKNEVH